MFLWYLMVLWYLDIAAMFLWYLMVLWYLYVMTLLFWYFIAFLSVVVTGFAMFLVMGGTFFFIFITCFSLVRCSTMLLLFVGTSFLVMSFAMRDFNFLTNCFIVVLVLS